MKKLTQQLQELGFLDEEIECYLKLSTAGQCSVTQRLQMLIKKRKETLEKIHQLEKRLISMDIMKKEIKDKI